MEEPRTAAGATPDLPPAGAPERIAKRIARAGICSRRDAERLIAAGRVTVNGTAITSAALNVTAADKITVDGQSLPAPERARLFRYYKPKGRITTARDPEGRATIFDDLPKGLPRLVTVGRLDFNTEGLLLLTNDGALARALELPETGWLRRYRVRAFGAVDEAALARLKKGITLEGISYGPVEATLERRQGDNAWLMIGIREGKNREVRKILTHLGLTVNRLIRVSFGPFQLGNLEEGSIEEVPRKVLIEQTGHLMPGAPPKDMTGTAKAKPRDDKPRPPRPGKGSGRRRERAGADRRRTP